MESFLSFQTKKRLTGGIDHRRLRPAFLLDNLLNLLRLQNTHDLIDNHFRANGLILARHLRTKTGCRLAGREVGAVHTGLGGNDIIIGGTLAKL